MDNKHQESSVGKQVKRDLDKTSTQARAARNILVVGGYGNVGRTITKRLGTEFPGRVIVAGRNIQTARDFVRDVELEIIPMTLDVHKPDSLDDVLDEVGLVVMCVDQQGTDFVYKCIEYGIDYIDITASIDLLEQLEALDNEARLSGSTVLLSVGLSPGLTNLLASYAQTRSRDANLLDIFILLGLGDRHGDDAIQWTVKNLFADFWKQENGKVHKRRNFEEYRETIFPGAIGARRAYRFNFSDQHTLMKTLNFDSASTWLCFDSAPATRMIAASTRSVTRRLLQTSWMQRALVKLMKSIHIGADLFVLQVKVGREMNNGEPDYETAIMGRGEGRSTGIVAAKVAALAFRNQLPSGVFHIEQLIDAGFFLDDLQDDGFIWDR
ncbi:MAG: saccharopine dehydrogenase NADP-binding domain-containing protein [Anaerolineales bacterium]|nr:saccharopine dehydrogenase NADP-binding domain-containing protein [Anaerolineales bacterium]